MPELKKTSPGNVIRSLIRVIREIRGTNGHKLFLSVGRMAELDVERLLNIPAFPCAIVSVLDSELSEINSEIWRKTVAVTIIRESSSSPFIDEPLEWLDMATELLIDAIQETRSPQLYATLESADSSFSLEAGSSIVWRTVSFAFDFDRKTV